MVSLLSVAQSEADIKLPKIVPPSPDAAALGKYGQMPVNKITGIPSIEIPIYEIKTPRFSLPVSLSYHASGIKVEEMASWVGTGWSLSAGGMITRSIVGMADDCPTGYFANNIKKASEIQWPTDMFYIADVLNRRIDTDPDNFFYNFNNHSGSFVFGDDKKPVLIPYQPTKVNFNPSTKNFDVVDENGNMYYFDTKENVTSSLGANSSGISTWYLTQMVSADRSDTIKFAYSTDAGELTDYSYSFSQSIGQNVPDGPEVLQPFSINSSWRLFHPVRIKNISFNGGKVDFIPKGGRLDNGNVSLDSVIIYNQDPANRKYKRIKSFKLVTDYFYAGPDNDFYGNPVREADKHRLKLEGVQEIGSDKVVVKRYQFGYDPMLLPQLHSFAQDRWGYFNGKGSNRSLLQSQTVIINSSTNPTSVTVGMDGPVDRGADRSVSPEHMKAGVLNKIIYPTGGYTTLTYDCHKYKHVENVTNTNWVNAAAFGFKDNNVVVSYKPTAYMLEHGGNIFRVQVSTVQNQPLAYVKVVRLPDSVIVYNSSLNWDYSRSGLSTTITLPLVADVQYQLIAFAQGGGQPNTFDPLAVATIGTSYPVTTETEITENVGGLRISSIKNYDADGSIASTENYAYGTNTNNESGLGVRLAFFPVYKHPKTLFVATANESVWPTFKTIYSNSSVYHLATLSGSPIAYPTVTVYHGQESINAGKSVYKYDIYPDSVMPIFGTNINTVKPISVLWKNGEPKWEGHYSNNGNNQYSLVQEKENFFDIISRKKGVGTTIWYTQEPSGFSFDNPTLGQDGFVSAPGPNGGVLYTANHFSWFDYPFSTGSRVLRQSTDTQHAADGTSMSTSTRYYYDNLGHMFPTRIATRDSKGDSIKTFIYYPQDMVITSRDPTGVYNAMAMANILTPTIEQYQSKNSTQFLYEKNNYDVFSTNMIKPKSIEKQMLSKPSEVRLQYLGYDSRGNLGSVVKDSGPKISYGWGYNKKYPVSEVLNAASNEFYYQGFEEDATRTLGNAHTGQYYYAGTNYPVNWSLPNTRSYVISYWYLNAGVWKYMPEQPFTGTFTLNNGSGYDDIRIHPKDAQMKTYSYTPLVGITSETNAAHQTTYYKYDGAGRLMEIRDQDDNIVKTFQYSYRQP
jgi:YD repeat-containing protein